MKKIISILLVFSMLFSVSAYTVSAEETINEKATYAVQLLKSFNIVHGDENGNMNFNDNVTRAEFAKMAIASSAYRNSVASSSNISPFSDVKYKYWGAAYIKTAVDAGYIKGYPDSTFRPENHVLLEEGVTICLKLLGYSDSDFKGVWPHGQMAKANELKLLDNVSVVAGQKMKRIDVMNLIYNTLSCKTASGVTLISTFDYTCHEDAVIVMTKEKDDNISSGRVLTSIGTNKYKDAKINQYVGYKGDLYLDTNNVIVAFVPSEKLDEDDYKDELTKSGYVVHENVSILMTSEKDEGLSANKVVTSAGTFKTLDESVNWYIGYEGDLYLNGKGEIMSFKSGDKLSEEDYKYYLKKQNYIVHEDTAVLMTHEKDSTLDENKIVTSVGTLKTKEESIKWYIGYEGDIYLDSKSNIISFKPGDKLSEEDYKDELIKQNYVVHEDAVVVMTHEFDDNVASDKVVTSVGTLKTKEESINWYIGYEGDIYLDSKSNIISFKPGDKLSEEDYKDELTKQNYVVHENAVIIMTPEFDDDILEDKIVTSAGTFDSKEESVAWYIGYKGDIYLNSKGEIMSFDPIEELADNDYEMYLSKQGYVTYDDTVLVATSNEDPSVASNKIVTSNGTFTITDSFDRTLSGRKGKLVVKTDSLKESYVFSFEPYEQTVETYVLNTLLDNSILVFDGNNSKSISVNTDTVLYHKTTKGTVSTLRNTALLGDSVKVYKNSDGKIEYITMGTGYMDGPYVLASADKVYSLGVDSSTRYYRDGKAVDVSELRTNDVIYYSENINAVWAYSDKVAGVYEGAFPTKDNIETVTVSGKTYEIETANAYSKFATGGKYNFGDSVILLLGRNGQVADVISTANTTVYGYITKASTKDYTYTSGETYTSNYVEVTEADGNVSEYKVNKDYSSYLSSLCSVKITNGTAVLSKVTTGSNISGTFVYSKMKIGTTLLADDVKILDIMTTSSQETPVAVTVYPQRLDGCSISNSDVLYYTKNADGKIDTLFLNDYTGDGYQYGVVTGATYNSVNHGSTPTSYSLYADGISYTTNIAKALAKGNAVKIYISNSKVEKVDKLLKVSEKITDVDYTELKTAKTTYKFSGNVKVYSERRVGSNVSYFVAALSDITENSSVEAYYTSQDDKIIRVLIIKN